MTPTAGQTAELTAPPLETSTNQIPGTTEQRLLHEYQWLREGLRYGLLTPEQQERIPLLRKTLDDLDEQSPGAQYMRQQMKRLEAYVDELEAKINALPDAKQA